MDTTRFDKITQTFVLKARSRRSLVKLAAGAALAAALGRIGREESVAAACRKVGDECRRAGQCCSGVCKGPDGKKTCRAHNVGTCTPDQDTCKQFDATCNGRTDCFCRITTGGASFCSGLGSKSGACERDADCEARGFPAGSACVRRTSTSGCEAETATFCAPPCGRVAS